MVFTTPSVTIKVSGARGPKGPASGPLGSNSVGASEIKGSDIDAINEKLGIMVNGVFRFPNGVVIAQGLASPEGNFAAPAASLYLTPAATYRKATGTGNTGWVSIG